MTGISSKWVSFATVATGTVMGTMDSSIILISLPALTDVFHTSPSIVLWLTLAYNLVLTGTVLIMGRVADILGRKRVYSTGFIVFTAGLILSSLAQDVFQLIACRIFQAVGSAMLHSSANAIVTTIFPPKEKGKAMGILEAVAGAGLMAGPALGGMILDAFGWRAIFYLRIPISVIGSFAAWKLLKEMGSPEKNRGFDFRGAGLLFGGLSSLLFAVNQAQEKGWTSVFVLGFLAVGAAALAGFIRTEGRTPHPVVDLTLFRNRAFAAGNSMLILYHVGSAILLFTVPFFMIAAAGYSSSQAGLALMVFPMMLLLVAPLSGWLSDRIGSRLLTSVGLGLQCVGLFIVSRTGLDASLPDVVIRLALTGLGTGLFTTPAYNIILGSAPGNRLGTASAMIPTMRNVGGACGMAVGGAIFVSRKAYHLASSPAVLPVGSPENLAIAGGFHDTLTVAALISATAVTVSVLTRGGPRNNPPG